MLPVLGTPFGHTPGHTRRVFRSFCSENGRKMREGDGFSDRRLRRIRPNNWAFFAMRANEVWAHSRETSTKPERVVRARCALLEIRRKSRMTTAAYRGTGCGGSWTAGCLLLACVIPIPCGGLAPSPEAKAGCGKSARPDPWTGCSVMGIPTPTLWLCSMC
jgi:hypothetical protein